jgi:energy-coupling factor transporter ATP-binding protein EcfA2
MPRFAVGSRWQRWDPHLHAPGTLLNDQYQGDWEGFFEKIEQADPAPVALGITDYFTLGAFRGFVAARPRGACPSVQLVFPNIELRLIVATARRTPINVHFLVCPDDLDFLDRIEEKLRSLTFHSQGEDYPCSEDGLIRLGRVHRSDPKLDAKAALREGANQFKVGLEGLRRLMEDAWFKANVLVGVAGGADGIGGVPSEASFHSLRRELGDLAQFVLSGNPSDRDYWLGSKGDQANEALPKACIHGSDAHSLEAVLNPGLDRFCWIRGAPTFDALRQAIVEPARRVFVGRTPPLGAGPADTISNLRVDGAPWFENADITLNPGLVTIIGARGSGKTALADLLAVSAGALETEPGPASFVGKAGQLLEGTKLALAWCDGTISPSELPDDIWTLREPRVQYLSQQFVERLCNPEELGETLKDEIERVVFSAIEVENRLDSSSFPELRGLLVESARSNQESARAVIKAKSRAIADDLARRDLLPALRVKADEARRARMAIEAALADIAKSATSATAEEYARAKERLDALQARISAEERRRRDLDELASEIARQEAAAETAWTQMKSRYIGLLPDETWALLRLRPADSCLPTLRQLSRDSAAKIAALRATGEPEAAHARRSTATLGLEALTKEVDRLAKALGLDKETANRKSDLDKRLPAARSDEEKASKAVSYAEGADERIKQAQAGRLAQYELVFESLLSERATLEQLYEPLHLRIRQEPRLSKLAFVVSRSVDLDAWTEAGESLLDLRKGPFSGRGTLKAKARAELLPAWADGRPSQAKDALRSFLDRYGQDAVRALAQGVSPVEFGEWVFSTDHITVRYDLQYEDVPIGILSPGSKGVVLLTLYLGLDKWDRRPLLIDQPEENLDPSSVFSDLVPFFRDAATRRQIVMVTHNANLVVNADADQVIVASAQRHSASDLPQIRYEAGGLEDPVIQAHVCRLLEGGADAFRRRWRRYGLVLQAGANTPSSALMGGSLE